MINGTAVASPKLPKANDPEPDPDDSPQAGASIAEKGVGPQTRARPSEEKRNGDERGQAWDTDMADHPCRAHAHGFPHLTRWLGPRPRRGGGGDRPGPRTHDRRRPPPARPGHSRRTAAQRPEPGPAARPAGPKHC